MNWPACQVAIGAHHSQCVKVGYNVEKLWKNSNDRNKFSFCRCRMRWYSNSGFIKSFGAARINIITWSRRTCNILMSDWLWITWSIPNHMLIDRWMGATVPNMHWFEFKWNKWKKNKQIKLHLTLQRCNAIHRALQLMGMHKVQLHIELVMSFNSIVIRNLWCKDNQLSHARTMEGGQGLYQNVSRPRSQRVRGSPRKWSTLFQWKDFINVIALQVYKLVRILAQQ